MDSSTTSGSSRCNSPTSECGDVSGSLTKVRKLCCVGAGYVGGPTAAIFALQNPHIQVTVVDRDSSRIQKWKSKHLPVHEPGLARIVRITRDGTNVGSYTCNSNDGYPIHIPAREPNLSFSLDVEGNLAAADIVFVSVNTPTKTTGLGAGAATNLSDFESVITTIAQYVKPGCIVVEKSTVPCGTAQIVRKIIAYHRPNDDIEVLSNPEFLAEGTAVKDLLYPDRVLIGSSSNPRGLAAAELLRNLYSSWVEPSKILTVNVWSSELAKLVANAMLAQRISSINTISAICDRTGADIDEVSFAIGQDTRIGSKFLKAGLGFGGSCFKKDILSLVYLSNSLHLPEVGDYWMSVLTVNEFQRSRFMQNVVNKLHGALFGKKITVLGFTFKEDTNDTRESPAVDVIKELLQERPREIAIFDPGCTPTEVISKISEFKSIPELHAVKPHGPIEAYSNVYDACKDSRAVLILTPWKQFAYPPRSKDNDNNNLAKSMEPVFKLDSGRSGRSGSSGSSGGFACHPTEMDIVKLEGYASRTTNSDDPLKRLRSQPACPDNCQACADAQTPRRGASTENVDWELVAFGMKEPKWVFDGRNIVDCKEMSKLGFRVENLGKGIHGQYLDR